MVRSFSSLTANHNTMNNSSRKFKRVRLTRVPQGFTAVRYRENSSSFDTIVLVPEYTFVDTVLHVSRRFYGSKSEKKMGFTYNLANTYKRRANFEGIQLNVLVRQPIPVMVQVYKDAGSGLYILQISYMYPLKTEISLLNYRAMYSLKQAMRTYGVHLGFNII